MVSCLPQTEPQILAKVGSYRDVPVSILEVHKFARSICRSGATVVSRASVLLSRGGFLACCLAPWPLECLREDLNRFCWGSCDEGPAASGEEEGSKGTEEGAFLLLGGPLKHGLLPKMDQTSFLNAVL